MRPFVERKVRNGKLIRLSIDAEHNRVQLTGDFFMYPEEGLALVEDALSEGLRDPGRARNLLEKTVRVNNLVLLGFRVQDLLEMLQEARR